MNTILLYVYVVLKLKQSDVGQIGVDKMKVYAVTGSEDGLLDIFTSFKRASDRAIGYVTHDGGGYWIDEVEVGNLVRVNGDSIDCWVESWWTA
jgi:hypothetical protein